MSPTPVHRFHGRATLAAAVATLCMAGAAHADLGTATLPSAPPAPAKPPVISVPPGRTPIPRDITVEQRPLAEIAAPQSDFAVTAWVDHQDSTYRPGEDLRLYVQTNEDAYITVVDVGTSGKVHIVYPNANAPDGYVKAGQVLPVPAAGARFAFQVGGPAGTELLKIIATKKPVALLKPAQLVPAGPYKMVKGTPAAIAKDMTLVLREDKATGGWTEYNMVARIAHGPAVAAADNPALSQTTVAPVAVQGSLDPSPITVVAPPSGAFRLTVGTDKPVYRLGENVSITIATERDCRLTLLNAGTSGKMTMLFPNRYQPENLLRAGQVARVPGAAATFDFRASGPEGVEGLIAICRTDDTPVINGPLDFQRQAFIPVGDTRQVAKDLSIVLSRPDATIAHAAASFVVSP